jgi:hypothetical protein
MERGRIILPRQRNAETHPACQPHTCAAPEKGSVGGTEARLSKYKVESIEFNNRQAVQKKLRTIGACDLVSLFCVRQVSDSRKDGITTINCHPFFATSSSNIDRHTFEKVAVAVLESDRLYCVLVASMKNFF